MRTENEIYEQRIKEIQTRNASTPPTYVEAHKKEIRVKAAIAAMQSLMLNPTFNEKEIAERAVKQADALIEELKKKEKP